MSCGYELCIYNREFKCLLEGVEIDDIGLCRSCIIIYLEKEFLEAEKERQLEELESRYRAWNDNSEKVGD